MSAALAAVEAIYSEAQKNLSMMLAACKTEEEHDQVVDAYTQARKNYLKCLNASFHEDDPALIDLIGKAEKSTESLRKIESQLGNLTEVLHVLTTAVGYGSKIVSKVVAV